MSKINLGNFLVIMGSGRSSITIVPKGGLW
jgi:hypothetical protein